ncbi:hypothetical protein BDN67DRAFT_742389 [Paxillus ammoniavirescens]|nr:hypothetical protein BDN67DRAFT_742389 [Paxillus ammoniavirescens]
MKLASNTARCTDPFSRGWASLTQTALQGFAPQNYRWDRFRSMFRGRDAQSQRKTRYHPFATPLVLKTSRRTSNLKFEASTLFSFIPFIEMALIYASYRLVHLIIFVFRLTSTKSVSM